MAEISAQLVKQLREMTDAGMMDCKKALVEVGGVIEKAVEYLREKGLSKAAKKADRIASEGIISLKIDSNFKKGSLLEINSETDFVAKNDGFKALVEKCSDLVFANSLSDVNKLNALSVDGVGFDEYLKGQIAKIGENIVVRRITTLESNANEIVNAYVHNNGRVGVLLSASFKQESNVQKIAELLRNICMHAAAMKPKVLHFSEFGADFIQKEKKALIAEIQKENEELKRLGKTLKHIPEFISRGELSENVLKTQEQKLKDELKKQGKPEAIWDKILPGQMERFIADNTLIDQRLTLLGQFFVMDDKKTIEQVLCEQSKAMNDDIKITRYVRFELGEGIEKKVEDFAAEVAAQMQ